MLLDFSGLHRVQDRALQLPKQHEMHPRDKYTIFSAMSQGYRKGIHKVPKWTRVGFQLYILGEMLTTPAANAESQPQGLLNAVTLLVRVNGIAV